MLRVIFVNLFFFILLKSKVQGLFGLQQNRNKRKWVNIISEVISITESVGLLLDEKPLLNQTP
jgi:uncharacterized membrane protein HdeD (DUF308 family)